MVDAPGYDAVIKKPMDLSTVKARIESGVCRRWGAHV